MVTKIELSTMAISPSGDKEKLYPSLEYIEHNDTYLLKIRNEQGIVLGDMTFRIKDTDKYNSPCPKYVYIINMVNLSKHKHIGTAMHEFAFKYSEERGAGGRIQFEAVRNSHYFHFKNGYINTEKDEVHSRNYYFRLAETLIKAQGTKIIGDSGNGYLYLPGNTILEKRKKLGVQPSQSAFESKMDERQIELQKNAERIISEAEKASFAIKTLLGMRTVGKKIRDSLEENMRIKLGLSTSFKDSLVIDEALKQSNPGLFCTQTQYFLNEVIGVLVKLLPIDTAEKQKTFDIMLAGTFIFVMAYQDKQYGKQPHFNNQLLYPHRTMDELFNMISDDEDYAEAIAKRFGEAALIHHSIPFDVKIPIDLFPDLNSIPEFETRFAPYTHANNLMKEAEPKLSNFPGNLLNHEAKQRKQIQNAPSTDAFSP